MNTPTISTDMLAIPLQLIDANPWQPRGDEDHAHVKGLAESIAEHGLLQTPTARPHPTKPGRYQLAFGHSRLAAFRFLEAATLTDSSWQTFPLVIRELSDRQMADAAAQENVSRKNLSAIETARAIQRYIADFSVTQAEAGKVYGYATQAGVSNLLRLLQLPEPVVELVHTGQLAERHARQLIAVARFDGKRAAEIAQKVVGSEQTSDKSGLAHSDQYQTPDYLLTTGVSEFIEKRGERLSSPGFELSWPKKPMALPAEISVKGAPEQLQACTSCEFKVKGRYDGDYCMRPACLQAKIAVHALAGAKKAAKDLGIPLAMPGEKVKVIFSGSWNSDDEDAAKAAIKSKHESLRIVVATKVDQYGTSVARVTGHKDALLGTVDEAALTAKVKPLQEKAAAKAAARSMNSPEAREAENAKREEMRDRAYMVRRAGARILRTAMPTDAKLQRVLLQRMLDTASSFWFEDDYIYDNEVDIDVDEDELETTEGQSRTLKAYDAAKPDERATILAAALISDRSYNPAPERLVASVESVAKQLNVRLPKGWSDAALTGEIPADKPWRVTDEEDDGDDE
jgi:ParB/RepB/Spo0J family partition protein